MGSASDTTELFQQADAEEMGFRQGVVLTFNATTKENTINMGGTVLTNVTVFDSGATALAVNDVVGLLRSKTSYFILGRIIIPG